jgi:hypothetical protein
MDRISKIIYQSTTDDLWDLSAEILTELSRRDDVDYRIKATEKSVQKKLLSL